MLARTAVTSDCARLLACLLPLQNIVDFTGYFSQKPIEQAVLAHAEKNLWVSADVLVQSPIVATQAKMMSQFDNWSTICAENYYYVVT